MSILTIALFVILPIAAAGLLVAMLLAPTYLPRHVQPLLFLSLGLLYSALEIWRLASEGWSWDHTATILLGAYFIWSSFYVRQHPLSPPPS